MRYVPFPLPRCQEIIGWCDSFSCSISPGSTMTGMRGRWKLRVQQRMIGWISDRDRFHKNLWYVFSSPASHYPFLWPSFIGFAFPWSPVYDHQLRDFARLWSDWFRTPDLPDGHVCRLRESVPGAGGCQRWMRSTQFPHAGVHQQVSSTDHLLVLGWYLISPLLPPLCRIRFPDVYTNPNLMTWVGDFQQPFPKDHFEGQCWWRFLCLFCEGPVGLFGLVVIFSPFGLHLHLHCP